MAYEIIRVCSDLPAAPPLHQQQQLQFIAALPRLCLRVRGHQMCLWPRRPSCHRPRADQRTRTVAADEPRLLPIKVLPHRTAASSGVVVGGLAWPVVMAVVVVALGQAATVHLPWQTALAGTAALPHRIASAAWNGNGVGSIAHLQLQMLLDWIGLTHSTALHWLWGSSTTCDRQAGCSWDLQKMIQI